MAAHIQHPSHHHPAARKFPQHVQRTRQSNNNNNSHEEFVLFLQGVSFLYRLPGQISRLKTYLIDIC